MNEFHGGDQENQTIDAAMQDGNQRPELHSRLFHELTWAF